MSETTLSPLELPTSWTITTLGAVVEYGKTSKAEPSELEANDWILELEDIEKDSSRLLQRGTFFQRQSKSTKNRFQAGDVLYGKLRPYLNKVLIAGEPGYCTTEILPLKVGPHIDNRYLFYWLKHPVFLKYVEAESHGMNMPRLGTETGKAAPFVLAPRNEQTRIANQLDTLLARVQACNDRFDAIPALLKRFRQAVLTAAISGAIGADASKSTLRKAYPNVRLSEVAQSRLGKMLDKQKNTGTPTPYIGNINVRWFSFDLANLQHINIENREKAGLEIRDGDVFVCEGGEPGRCAIWNAGPTNIVFQKALHRVRPVEGRLLPQWLAYCIRNMTDSEQMTPLYTGTTIRHLTGSSLSKLLLPLPSVEEQTEIVRRVEALFALADRIEARCSAARTQAQRLSPLVLAKAFRGELVQQDPQDEPASVLLQRIAAQPAKVQTSRGRRRSQRETHPSQVPVLQPDWTVLPDGAWAAPADPDGHAAVALLAAVLKAWGRPMPQMQARLATLLCQQPRLFTAVLPADQAAQWRRLVGSAADPLPAQVTSFQPATNSQWGRALAGMRARGELAESGSGPQGTWVLGPGAAHIETAGWPEGRAEWVAAYFRAHGVEAILPLLAPAAQEFVNVKAA